MVATRRGTRVGSSPKNTSDETSGATEKAVMEGNQSQSELTGDSQPDELKDNSSAPSLAECPPKRETRRSTRRLAEKKQPDSTHEADISESESCCSVVSEVQATPRTRRRTVAREKPKVTAKDDVSEADSCSSAVSATPSRRAPRSLRKRVQAPAASDAAKTDDGDLSGAESCSSVISLTKVLDTRRITRSRRRTVPASTEADPSEPESCSSSVSGLRGSVVRRSARNQKGKLTEPIPLSLDETTDTPSSQISKRLRDRRQETKSGLAEEMCDSDECKSGPSTSPWRSTRRQAKGVPLVGGSDSESVPIDVYTSQDSPSSLRGRGTPCSSRTGSAGSNRAVPVTRSRSKAGITSDLSATLTSVAAMPEEELEGGEHEPIPPPSESVAVPDAEDTVEPMDSTMTMDTGEAQECTMIEDTAADCTLVMEPDEPVKGEEVQEPQSTQETEAPLSAVSVPEKVLEGSETETQTQQEEAVDEMAATVTEDRDETGDVAMENNEPEFVKANHAVEDQAYSENAVDAATEAPVLSTVEKNVTDNEEMAECETGVEVLKDADEAATASVDKTSILLSDAERPCSSSHTPADLATSEQPSKRTPPWKEMTSLLDSSEDEESPDEGLSADEEEEEGPSHEAVDSSSEEEMTCPEEGQSSAEALRNGLFVIDTRPGLRPDEKYYVGAKQTEAEDEDEFVDEEEDDDEDEDLKVLFAPKKPLTQLSSSIDPGLKLKELGGLYISFDGGKPKGLSNGLKTQKKQNSQDELLKKSVIIPDLEKKDALPQESKREAKLKRKTEREKTTGDAWFNMKAPELTEELRNDLKAMQMRSAMDPKRFYKKNDREGFPKYFQVGTVVDSPVDFYHSRIPKKQRKRTIVEELLADAEFRSYNKKKYQEIMTEKAAQAAGKINKKKHKFHKKKINK